MSPSSKPVAANWKSAHRPASFARSGCAGLDLNRPPLRAGRARQRAHHLEMLADVIDAAHLGRVRDATGFAIPQHRIGIDRLEQLVDHLEEFFGAAVAPFVVGRRVVAEVLRFLREAADHRIVGDSPARNVIDAGVQPRDVERMVVRHRHGGHEAQVLGHAGDRDRHRQRIVPRPRHAPFDGVVRPPVDQRRAGDIGEERAIELAVLQQSREIEIQVRRAVHRIAVPRSRIAPFRERMDQRNVGNEVDQLGLGHWNLLGARRGWGVPGEGGRGHSGRDDLRRNIVGGDRGKRAKRL
jgi:hypothetical protein